MSGGSGRNIGPGGSWCRGRLIGWGTDGADGLKQTFLVLTSSPSSLGLPKAAEDDGGADEGNNSQGFTPEAKLAH